LRAIRPEPDRFIASVDRVCDRLWIPRGKVLQAASPSHVESWRADRRHHRQKAIPRPQLHNTTRADHDLTYHASLAPKHFHTFRRHASSTARAEEGPSATLVGSAQANLNQYLEKRILVQLNGSRKVMGILRGYDVRLQVQKSKVPR
jgi:hypothetical protein